MKRPENNKWLDDALSKVIDTEKSEPNFEKWKQEHPQAVEMLTSRAARGPSASKSPHSIRIMIMKSPITKLAAAAVIIIGLLIGIYLFGGPIDVTSVAWAVVTEKVYQIQTFTFRTSQKGAGIVGVYETQVYNSSRYGKKIDVYQNGRIVMHTYVLPAEKATIAIMPAGKKCQRTLLTEEELQRELQEGDPREVVRQFMSMKYEKLGRNKIDGVEVEGIKVENPEIVADMFENAIGRLWVDVETELPVRIEIDGVSNRELGQMHMVVDKFQWNVELDASKFEPNIPADYTLLEE